MSKDNDCIKTVKVFNYQIHFKKIRSEVWLDGFHEHCKDNEFSRFNMLVLPPNYDSHILLSSLHGKNIALRDGMSLLASEKSKKRSGNINGFGVYCDDERTDSEDNDDDDDSIDSCFYSGITNSMLNKKDICVFIENLCESNPMWDIGCQSQYYCSANNLPRSKYYKSCYCPFEFHNFDSPFAFWSHCKPYGGECIIDYTMQKLLEELYSKIVTKNDYDVKVSSMHLLTLNLFSVTR